MTPKVAISDSGSATPAMMVARMVRRKMKHAPARPAPTLEHQRELHVADRGADGVGAVADDGRASRRPGIERCSRGSSRSMRCHGLDHVGAGLALDVDHDGGLAFDTSRRPGCSRGRR